MYVSPGAKPRGRHIGAPAFSEELGSTCASTTTRAILGQVRSGERESPPTLAIPAKAGIHVSRDRRVP